MCWVMLDQEMKKGNVYFGNLLIEVERTRLIDATPAFIR